MTHAGSRVSNANSTALIGKRLTLSSIRIDHLQIDFNFIEIDIEAAELQALRGAERTLRKLTDLTCKIYPRLSEQIRESSKENFQFLDQFNPDYFYCGPSIEPNELLNNSHQYELNTILNH
jgi:hypothetical protein